MGRTNNKMISFDASSVEILEWAKKNGMGHSVIIRYALADYAAKRGFASEIPKENLPEDMTDEEIDEAWMSRDSGLGNIPPAE